MTKNVETTVDTTPEESTTKKFNFTKKQKQIAAALTGTAAVLAAAYFVKAKLDVAEATAAAADAVIEANQA